MRNVLVSVPLFVKFVADYKVELRKFTGSRKKELKSERVEVQHFMMATENTIETLQVWEDVLFRGGDSPDNYCQWITCTDLVKEGEAEILTDGTEPGDLTECPCWGSNCW